MNNWTHYLTTYRRANYPIYLVHFLTARCPYKCPTCFYWQEIKTADYQKELTLDEIHRVTAQNPYVWQVTITGGEPFIRADLADIVVSYFTKAKAWRVSIHTTGSHSNRIIGMVKDIFAQVPHAQLSLHFSQDLLPDEQAEFRGLKGAMKKFLKTYNGLKAIQPEYPNLTLAIDTVYSAANHDQIDDVYNYIANELQPDEKSLILVRGNPEDPAIKSIDIAQYHYWAQRWHQPVRHNGFKSRVATRMKHKVSDKITDIWAGGKLSKPCTAGQKLVVINEYGDVTPCEMLHNFSPVSTVMGNLRDHDFSLTKLIESSQGQSVRSTIESLNCACTYECAALANTLTNPVEMGTIGLKSLV